VTVKPAAILVDGPQFRGHQRNKWDSSRSVRFNQDAQRQEDIIRQRDIINYLTKLRIGADKLDKYKQKEVTFIIYEIMNYLGFTVYCTCIVIFNAFI